VTSDKKGVVEKFPRRIYGIGSGSKVKKKKVLTNESSRHKIQP
jgi:hypothetical protein